MKTAITSVDYEILFHYCNYLLFCRYSTFCGYPPEIVKKLPKKDLAEEVSLSYIFTIVLFIIHATKNYYRIHTVIG